MGQPGAALWDPLDFPTLSRPAGAYAKAEGQRFPAMIAPCRFPSPNTEKDRFDAGFLLLYT